MPVGVYLHVPFCVSKCPYCDFYSLTATQSERDTYTEALLRAMAAWSAHVDDTADTLYFGGGTPSLLGGKQLARLVTAARRLFRMPQAAEITLEANPADDLYDVLSAFAAAGGNRLSLGMQAVNDAHLHALGRRHTTAQTEAALTAAHAAGIHNVSLDIMLGTPHQTTADVTRAVACCAAWGATHVSAYLLKLEPDTPFAAAPPPLPTEDETVALYHTAAAALEQHGFAQYEISNFAKPGCESRHNLKYWNAEPYIGIGPSAHSFWNGQRFAYPRSLPAFLNGDSPVAECTEQSAIAENSPEEYAMLRLRLTAGLTEDGYRARFGTPLPTAWCRRAARLPSSLVVHDATGIRLTRDGFLVSNAILSQLLT